MLLLLEKFEMYKELTFVFSPIKFNHELINLSLLGRAKILNFKNETFSKHSVADAYDELFLLFRQ